MVLNSSGFIPEPTEKRAFPLQTPHSGRHFRPTHPAYTRNRLRRRRRFTEGWYYRLTLPEENVSFAIILSIEDPGLYSDHTLCCIQMIGPDDDYIVQVDRDDTKFWAWNHQQGLGCTFEWQPSVMMPSDTTALEPHAWKQSVKSGFQILPTTFLGRVDGRDGTKGGLFDDDEFEPASCSFDFTIEPLCGWGDVNADRQKSTAGWLASFAVFEPHWQVTLADASATGTMIWKNKTYTFENAKFYAEKNWGAALPIKWYWTQCNSFDGFDQLSVTAGGGIRKIPFGKESLGMVSVHYNGTFYEAVPWLGEMEWDVATWGSWKLKGNCTFGDRPFEVEVFYECDPLEEPGLIFRAPTHDEGMVRCCKDTFVANCTLTLWELYWDNELSHYVRRPGAPLIDRASSSQGGAEVGGSPWWDTWQGVSSVKQPFRSLLRLPFRSQNAFQKVKQRLYR